MSELVSRDTEEQITRQLQAERRVESTTETPRQPRQPQQLGRAASSQTLCIAQWCAHVHAIQRLFGAAMSPSHEEVALLLHAMM